jgi:DNA invertase Pin-like site-specific DNA recombinase
MASAKANGKLKGKPPKLNPRQQAHLVKLHQQGSRSIPELADLFSVSRPTVYRVLDKARHRTYPDHSGQPAADMQWPQMTDFHPPAPPLADIIRTFEVPF